MGKEKRDIQVKQKSDPPKISYTFLLYFSPHLTIKTSPVK